MPDVDLVPWWGWLLLWGVLVLGAAAFLGLLVWRLVRRGLAVLADAGAAGERAGALMAQVEALPPRPRQPPAIFDEPTRLRAERTERLRRERRARARVVTARRQAVRGQQRGTAGSVRGPSRGASVSNP